MAGMSRRSRVMQPPLPQEVRDRLESVVENTSLVRRQIKEGRDLAHSRVLSLPEFLPKLCQCAWAVSDGCTKLAVLFSRPPAPSADECGMICGRVEQSTLQLTSTYFQLSPDLGRTLHKEVQVAVISILRGVENLITVLIEKGCSGNGARLQGTGTVWESCDATAKFPKDNRSAVLRVFISQLHLLKDACSEIEELKSNKGVSDIFDSDDDFLATNELAAAVKDVQLNNEASSFAGGASGSGPVLESEGDEDSGRAKEWTLGETMLVEPCIKLIQLSADITGDVSRLVISHGSVGSEQSIQELDRGADEVALLSPLVDGLADELSVPISWQECRKLGIELGEELLKFVDVLSNCHFCANAGKSWDKSKLKGSITEALNAIPSHDGYACKDERIEVNTA